MSLFPKKWSIPLKCYFIPLMGIFSMYFIEKRDFHALKNTKNCIYLNHYKHIYCRFFIKFIVPLLNERIDYFF